MRSKVIVLSLLLALVTSALAPSIGGAARVSAAVHATPVTARAHSNPAFLDRTRFLLHMGAAYFAFHHFVYNRYRNHEFSAGAPHRTRYIVEAGIATLFAYHEVKVALGIANGSSSNLLHALASPLNKLGATMGAIGNRLQGGQYTESDIGSLNGAVSTFGKQADASGYHISDVSVPIPGLGA